MTDTHTADPNTERTIAETLKLIAEEAKLTAERGKLTAEETKLRSDARWQPVVILGGMALTFATALASLILQLLRH